MRIFIIVVLVLGSLRAIGQIPGGIISAPVLEATEGASNVAISSILVGIELSNEMKDDIDQIRKAAGFVGQLKAVGDLIVVMESYGCLAQEYISDLNYVDGLLGPQASCLLDFDYNVSITRLQFAADLLNLLMTSGFSMEQGDRIKKVGTVMDHYRITMEDISKQKYRVRKIIRKYEREQENQKSEDWLWNMTYGGSTDGKFF